MTRRRVICGTACFPANSLLTAYQCQSIQTKVISFLSILDKLGISHLALDKLNHSTRSFERMSNSHKIFKWTSLCCFLWVYKTNSVIWIWRINEEHFIRPKTITLRRQRSPLVKNLINCSDQDPRGIFNTQKTINKNICHLPLDLNKKKWTMVRSDVCTRSWCNCSFLIFVTDATHKRLLCKRCKIVQVEHEQIIIFHNVSVFTHCV